MAAVSGALSGRRPLPAFRFSHRRAQAWGKERNSRKDLHRPQPGCYASAAISKRFSRAPESLIVIQFIRKDLWALKRFFDIRNALGPTQTLPGGRASIGTRPRVARRPCGP